MSNEPGTLTTEERVADDGMRIGYIDEIAPSPTLIDELQMLRQEMELIRRACWASPWESAQKAHEIASRCLERQEY